MRTICVQISALLSDYDGTLCPTDSIRNQEENRIPADLLEILWNISEKITVDERCLRRSVTSA
jgi:hypothetical protein